MPRTGHRSTTSWQPNIAEVVYAIHSLYVDQVRPMGHLVLRRLREIAAATEAVDDVEAMPMANPKYLRELCESCGTLTVTPAEGKEFVVLLNAMPDTFVDPLSTRDPYADHMWKDFGEYISSLVEEESTFPSGRYACAQVLRSRGLAFFQGLSLGELCHVVQLALDQRRILGHTDGKIVPFVRSNAHRRLQCAEQQLPVSVHAGTKPFASWDQLAYGLQSLLDQRGSVCVTHLKRLFLQHFSLVLSETVLGHTKLRELLVSPRLAGVCRVEVQSFGNSVIYPAADSASTSPEISAFGDSSSEGSESPAPQVKPACATSGAAEGGPFECENSGHVIKEGFFDEPVGRQCSAAKPASVGEATSEQAAAWEAACRAQKAQADQRRRKEQKDAAAAQPKAVKLWADMHDDDDDDA